MRIVLTGGNSFGCAVLSKLLEDGHDIAGVWTSDPKLATFAADRSICIFTGVTPSWLTQQDVDVLVNAHGTRFISEEHRSACRYGAIGYHPSLLPRHGGRNAVEWTVAARDPVTGGTVYQLDSGWDTGAIIKQDWCFVHPDWTASDLWREQLFPMGVRLLSDVLDEEENADRWPNVLGRPQDLRFATYEPPIHSLAKQ